MYKEQGIENVTAREAMLENVLSLVTDDENQMVNNYISEAKVISAVGRLGLDKSPRPDGFTIHFYRACWHIIKKDLCKMLNWTKGKKNIGGPQIPHFLL